MFIEDNFRKTYNVDLVRIVGEKIHRGLIYQEQGEEAFKKANLLNFSSPAIDLNSQTSNLSFTNLKLSPYFLKDAQQSMYKSKRQMNEVKCYTKSQIVYQNKIKRELISSQKAFRRPDLIRIHSQQVLREAKTASQLLNLRNTTHNSMKRSHHKSCDNAFNQRFPLNEIIQLKRINTPVNMSIRDDLSSRNSNIFDNSLKHRSEIFNQNSSMKKQGKFNIFQQIVQQQGNLQQNLNFQSVQPGILKKKSNFSMNNIFQRPQSRQEGFNILYHDNKDIKFQDIVPFVDYLQQSQNQEYSPSNYPHDNTITNQQEEKSNNEIESC